MKKTYLPAEWHKQSLIQLTWPHIDTDWAYMLEEVDACFLNIAYEILKRQPLGNVIFIPKHLRLFRPASPAGRRFPRKMYTGCGTRHPLHA